MLLGVAGPGGQFPRPVPVPHIIQGVLGIRFTHIHYTCDMQVLQLFSPVFAVFRPFCIVFCIFGPLAPRCARNPQQEHRNRGPGARAGRQRRPRRPVAAAAPRGPPGPERRRRERRGEPRRPGAREPGAERPPGGQPGRSGPRGSASTVEGTAGPGRRDRLPRTPGGPDRRRGGRRVGVAARAASGRAARRPTAREKGPGREPARPAAYRDSRRPRPARGRGEPDGAPRPERSGGSGGQVPGRRAPGPNAAGSTTPPQSGTA